MMYFVVMAFAAGCQVVTSLPNPSYPLIQLVLFAIGCSVIYSVLYLTHLTLKSLLWTFNKVTGKQIVPDVVGL